MAYPFIDLKKATKEELVAHLRDYCGVEKDGKKEELVQAILDFESANGIFALMRKCNYNRKHHKKHKKRKEIFHC